MDMHGTGEGGIFVVNFGNCVNYIRKCRTLENVEHQHACKCPQIHTKMHMQAYMQITWEHLYGYHPTHEGLYYGPLRSG